jgi:hypothetical protein
VPELLLFFSGSSFSSGMIVTSGSGISVIFSVSSGSADSAIAWFWQEFVVLTIIGNL